MFLLILLCLWSVLHTHTGSDDSRSLVKLNYHGCKKIYEMQNIIVISSVVLCEVDLFLYSESKPTYSRSKK